MINFYLSLITERSSGQAGELKVYSFSTFFFPKLRGGRNGLAGHSEVKRWTKAVDLFSYDLVLVPLHLGVHWALAVSHIFADKGLGSAYLSVSLLYLCLFQVIDLKSKTVKSYDSMGQRHDDICTLLLLVFIFYY